MRKSGNRHIILLILLLSLPLWQLHAQRLWSTVRLDRSSTYVGQPVQVTISVYTSTWFTRGIDPGNIKVNGAFTVYFRPVSVTLKEGANTYAGVQLKYNVFPYRNEDIVFPSLDITVESPPEGDYKGVQRALKTDERRISVKPVPPGFEEDQWLVASGMQVNQQWNGDIGDVKVGDVLERTISRTAYGTVSELIPPVAWDTLAGVSLYPSRSAVDNQKSKTAISASRVETMRYLFEKEGTVTLPEMLFTWYNPYREQLYKRTLSEVVIDVKPNPDLGLLESIRDSLQMLREQEVESADEDQPFQILGMSPKRLLALAAMILVALVLLLKIGNYTLARILRRRELYRQSEAYYFDQFLRAARHQNFETALSSLYRWIDQLKMPITGARQFAELYGSSELQKQVENIEFSSAAGESSEFDLHQWKVARKKMLYAQADRNDTSNSHWINP